MPDGRGFRDLGFAVYAHPGAVIFGDVTFGEGCSFWPYAVIRCEMQFVRIGRFSNLQDHAMIHVGFRSPTIVGDYCSVGHRATLHGCTIEDDCVIGVGATIMEDCIIGRGSIVAGHSFLPPNTVVPPGSIVMGSPGRVVRQTDASRENVIGALLYHQNAIAYARGDFRGWEDIDMDDLGRKADAVLSSQSSEA
jgi:carbonic anhydrase/acetyltransferase-like protein (isoleucine patch superfamily)